MSEETAAHFRADPSEPEPEWIPDQPLKGVRHPSSPLKEELMLADMYELLPACLSATLLLSAVCLSVCSQPITDSQRLFSIAVSRVQHLHLLAQRLFSDFVSLQKLHGD